MFPSLFIKQKNHFHTFNKKFISNCYKNLDFLLINLFIEENKIDIREESRDSKEKESKSTESNLKNTKKSDEDATDLHNEDKNIAPALKTIIKRERTHLKPSSLIMIPFLLIVTLILTLFKGSSNADSIIGIQSCSPGDFTFLVLIIIFLILMTVLNIALVKREYAIKLANNYTFVEGDLIWTKKLLVQFIIAAFIGGFVAGAFGLGGGTIYNPLLLSFKVPPSVSSSTGMYMIMFSSMTNSFLFLLSGYLNIPYAFWCASYVIIGVLIGLKVVNDMVKRTGRQSIIAFILTFVIILSVIVIPVYGLITILNDSEGAFSFGGYCG